jgi:hypothetical protein
LEDVREKKRSKVNDKFGDVPVNMMPNGYPLRGSTSDEWDKQLLEFVK